MTKKQTKVADKNNPELRKRHLTYLFWALVVIAVSLVQVATKSPIVTVAQFGVSVLALFMLLRTDKRFMRVHKAFRTASSIETAKVKHVQQHNQAIKTKQVKHSKIDAGLANANLNKKHGNSRDMIQD